MVLAASLDAGADAYVGTAMEKKRVSVEMSVSTRRDTVRAPFFHLGFPYEPGSYVCLRNGWTHSHDPPGNV